MCILLFDFFKTMYVADTRMFPLFGLKLLIFYNHVSATYITEFYKFAENLRDVKF